MRRLVDKEEGDLIGNIICFRSLSGRGKKGSGHFEMIFSFMFFSLFIFFLFLVLKPQDTLTLSTSVLEALYDSFEEKVHTNLTDMFVKADSSGIGPSDCFNITLPGRIFAYAMVDGGNDVTALNGTPVDSYLDESSGDGYLNIDKNSGILFYKVAISSEFGSGVEVNCDTLANYELGSIVERRVASYTKLKTMRDKYITGGRDALRAELKIPPVFDFAIVPENMTELEMVPNLGIPTSVDVQAQDYVTEVLKPDGTVVNERFTLKIW